jgi:hypothetical protein
MAWAVALLRDLSEAMVLAAWRSWKKPTTTLMAIRPARTPPSIQDLMPRQAPRASRRT